MQPNPYEAPKEPPANDASRDIAIGRMVVIVALGFAIVTSVALIVL